MTIEEARYVLATFDQSKMLTFIAKRAVKILRGELADACEVLVLEEEELERQVAKQRSAAGET